MNEDVTTNDVLSALGVDVTASDTTNTEGTTNEPKPGNETPAPATQTETGAETSGSSNVRGAEDEDPETLFQNDKQNKAFAQLRTENKQFRGVITNLGKALGIDAADPNAVMEAVESVLTQQQAAQQNVPPELLTKMKKLEQENQAFTQSQLKQKALFGFNAVKEQYSLKDSDITDFVKQLVDKDINPFEQDIDLISQYKMLNYDKIMEAAREEGRRLEAERLSKVNKHSSSPGTQAGAPNTGSTEKINTVTGLTAFLSGKQ